MQSLNISMNISIKIKKRYKAKGNFSFSLATTKEIKPIIRDLPNNKAAGGKILVNILKKLNFSLDELTICVNNALISGKFPITFKNANVIPVHKKDDPTDKTNSQPVSDLPLLSKVFERVIYNQLGKYMDTFLNELLRGLERSTLLNMPSLSY